MAEVTNEKAQVDVTSDSCSIGDITCSAREAVGNDVLDWVSTMAMEAMEGFTRALFTGALEMPMALISNNGGAASFLQNNLAVLSQAIVMFMIIVFAGKLVFQPSAETVSTFGGYLFRVLVVSAGSIIIAMELIKVADGYSDWILDKALAGQDLAEFVIDMLMVTGPAGAFIMLLTGFIGLIITGAQIVTMLARNMVIIPLLVGAAPVVVAGSYTQVGKQWWTTYLGWFAGWLLFKPAIATIYAAGFFVIKNANPLNNGPLIETWGQDIVDIMNLLSGIMILGFAMGGGWALLKAAVPGAAMVTGKLDNAGRMGAAVTASALTATGATMRPQGGVAAAAPTSVTPLNAAAGAGMSPGPTGSQGTPQSTTNNHTSNRPPSGWDTPAPATGAQGTPSTGSQGPTGPVGTSGMSNTTRTRSEAPTQPTGAQGTPTTGKGGQTQ